MLQSLVQVLSHYPDVLAASDGGRSVARVSAGLINDTWFVGDGFVLQRLHPIFAPEVNLDIAALTPILRAAGIPVPELVAHAQGGVWLQLSDCGDCDGVWRVLSRLPGRTIHRVEDLGEARAAGTMLARFHGALRESTHAFAFARLGVHDTFKHMDGLDEALATHTAHRLRDQIAAVADEVRARWAAWGVPPVLPERIAHGDPKISNFLFEGHGENAQVVGVIDLDTMARTPLDVELGDALRSWCNTQDESGDAPSMSVDVFEATMVSYGRAARGWLTEAELCAFPAATERICLELTARFAADALNERYFGWDPGVAPTRGDHNLIRARNQLALARDAARQRPRMEAVVERLLTERSC